MFVGSPSPAETAAARSCLDSAKPRPASLVLEVEFRPGIALRAAHRDGEHGDEETEHEDREQDDQQHMLQYTVHDWSRSKKAPRGGTMQGSEGEGYLPFGAPRGEPGKPLVEAFILFIAFYLSSYVSSAAPGMAVSRLEYHLMVVAVNLPRALLVLYVMATGEGLRLFGLGRFRWMDIARGFLAAAGALRDHRRPGPAILRLRHRESAIRPGQIGP